ncbi:hypothetical protein MHU86_1460 [Fragilaria crotonensis]|nr:hypothetical protein MHU86_1460 [Fragilaria crotonensis]
MRPPQRRLSSGQMQRRGSHERESRSDEIPMNETPRNDEVRFNKSQRSDEVPINKINRSDEVPMNEPMQRRPSSFDREQIRRGRSREDLPLDDLPLPPPMAPPPIGGIGFPPPPSYETVAERHQRENAVSDQEIVDVIDRECGPLLREVRGKLGLGGEALIIPSDVHDYLVDKKLLHQEAFVGATGGNIMDTDHLAEFVRLVDGGEKNSHSRKRTGAALFFREHVVSIVKVPHSGGKWSYDMIDSLPGSNGMATRTRCFDLPAFEAYVRYYASAKFSESNREYIDNNDWNDMMADFDPRVFQGFVWGDR